MWRIYRLLITSLPTLAAVSYTLPGPSVFGINLFPYRLAILALLTLYLLWLFMDHRVPTRLGTGYDERMILSGVLVCWAAVTILWTRDVSQGLVVLVALLGYMALLVVLRVYGPVRRQELSGDLRRGWMIAIVCLSLAVWYEFFSGDNVFAMFGILEPKRSTILAPTGSFVNPNDLGAFFALGVAASLLNIGEHRKPSMIVGLISVIGVLGTVLSGSATAIIAFATGGVTYVLVRSVGWYVNSKHLIRIRVERKTLKLLAIILIGLVTSLSVFSDGITRSIAKVESRVAILTGRQAISNGGSSSLEARLSLVESGMVLIKKSRGLGVGLGAFPIAMNQEGLAMRTGGITAPHSLLLEVTAELGLMGLLLFSLLLVSFIFRSDPFNNRRGAVVVGALVVFLVASNGPSHWLVRDFGWVFLVTVSLHLSTSGAYAGLNYRGRGGVSDDGWRTGGL